MFMRVSISILLLLAFFVGGIGIQACRSNNALPIPTRQLTSASTLDAAAPTTAPTSTETPQARSTSIPTPASSVTPKAQPTFAPVVWNVYDPNPQHLWNRLFRQLYARTSKDGKEYGKDSLDLLQWDGTSNFFDESSYVKTIQLLDEFLAMHGEKLIANRLKRALFQRDVWAVFEWLTLSDDHPDQRRALESRLAQIIQRLALTKQEIESLPNNYQAAVNAQSFPSNYQSDKPETAFLPIGYFTPNSDWVEIGREGGPNAIRHVQDDHFMGRSTFLIFIRVPGGRAATLDFVRKLEAQPYSSQAPDLPVGTEVALVREMLLVDQQGNLVASPMVESIQFRHFYSSSGQMFYEFTLSRERVFAGETGGLRPIARDETGFPLFLFPGVDFAEAEAQGLESEKLITLNSCPICHYHIGYGITSIESYSRAAFGLPEGQHLTLIETTPALEAQITIAWKLQQPSWKVLQALWQKKSP